MVRGAWTWLGIALLACALFAVACGTSSEARPPITPFTNEHSPTGTPVSQVQQVAGTPGARLPTPSFENPVRWGYNPREYTNVPDKLPVFRPLTAGYRIETYAAGLQRPTGMVSLPDGRLLVIEQQGEVRLIEDGVLQRDPYYVVDAYFPDSGDVIELGLVGITIDPDFITNRYLYVYYTTANPHRRTVLARISDQGTFATGLREIMSLDADPACCHISGSMRFAPDGTLFVAVGDHQRDADAQDIGTPFGKILRINKDGTVPRDNPFVNTQAADPRVWAFGLRNPFDFAIEPLSGRIFATENGYLGQDAVLEIKKGKNYGWPGYGLAGPLEDMEQPLLFYNEPIGPAGMELYLDAKLELLRGSLLFCQFHRGGALHAVAFDAQGELAGDSIIAPGCTSDVTTGSDGFIYFLDYVGGIVYRIASGARS
ncbi:MAG: PQQ-dependent sugar dehydrogenase [Dehalococcoidia bacterium]